MNKSCKRNIDNDVNANNNKNKNTTIIKSMINQMMMNINLNEVLKDYKSKKINPRKSQKKSKREAMD